MQNTKRTSRIALMLLVCLCLSALSGALAEETVRFNTNSRIYQEANLSSRYVSLKKGTEATLIATRSGWAMIRINGVVGFTNAAHLTSDSPVDDDVAWPERVIARRTKVYAKPSTSARSLTVPKGMKVSLVATQGSWAMVKNEGNYAYIRTSDLTTADAAPDYSELLKNAQDAVILQSTRVYASPSTSAKSLRVSEGMKVRLLAVSGDWALVENSGNYAYMNAAHVATSSWTTSAPEPAATPAPTAVPTAAPDYSALLKNAKPGVLSADALVYASADTSAASVSLSKGATVNVLAINGDWALVEKNGSYGFMKAALLSPAATATPQPTATPAPTQKADTSDYFNSSKYTNEEKCYLFLTREMGLNSAAACGVLSNIRSESSFNPNCGGSYYGLCQWGGGRLTALKKFCSDNGYDYTTVEGQMRYLAYELKNSYPSVLKALQAVSNSPEGAYQAAYTFCYDYERPAAKATASVKRGNTAKDTYYPKYV